jgi:hypothetical protein
MFSLLKVQSWLKEGAGGSPGMTLLRTVIPVYSFFEHDLVRKPETTFRDHAQGLM